MKMLPIFFPHNFVGLNVGAPTNGAGKPSTSGMAQVAEKSYPKISKP